MPRVAIIRRSARTLAGAALLTLVLLATVPAAASAGIYVDDDTGSDSGPCTRARPCATIERGMDAAVRGEKVFVDGGSYAPATTITISLGRGLVAEEFTGDRESSTEIDSGADPAIRVDDADGREIVKGFRLRSTGTTIETIGPVTISDDQFAIGGADGSTRGVFITTNDPITIEDSSFTGSGVATDEDGVVVDATDNPNSAYPELAIKGNDFDALRSAVRVDHSVMGMHINRNRITGTHAGEAGGGIAIQLGAGSTAGLRRNSIVGSSGDSTAISVYEGSSYSSSVSTRFNRIDGFATGLRARDLFNDLYSYGDVFFDNGTAVVAQDDEYNRVSLDQDTLWGNDLDIELANSGLDFDRSILEHPIALSGERAFCLIHFSRGPTTGGSECETFTTAADPGFVDPVGGDLHLTRDSAMVDAGGPQVWEPLGRRFDLEGDSRFADGDGDGECQRDIGADEFAIDGVKVDCVAPETSFTGHSGRRFERGDEITLRFRGHDERPASNPVRFRCRLDASRWRRCTSPQKFTFNRLGEHVFKVRAVDAAGNRDPSPARRGIKIVPCRTQCAR